MMQQAYNRVAGSVGGGGVEPRRRPFVRAAESVLKFGVLVVLVLIVLLCLFWVLAWSW